MASEFHPPGGLGVSSRGYVTLDCRHTIVSGEGGTLSIDWVARPDRCFVEDCVWNYGAEIVTDSSGLQDAGLLGRWQLESPSG